MGGDGDGGPVPVTRRVRAGELVGTSAGGIDRFLAVPYAAPPFGPGRFALPRPVPPWTGARDATRYGPSAPQNRAVLFADALPPINDGEADILHLNIWAPSSPPAGGCPVLVWFHGGALVEGSNRWRLFDGTRFAGQGLVVVVPNYRLGAEGFSVLDGAPLNLGLADQAAALRWVRDEITAFGGDPDRVTIAGHSAGGATVAALACAPTLRPGGAPVHADRDADSGPADDHDDGWRPARAVVQSGPLDARPPDEAAEITRRMAHALGLPATREAFARVAPAELLAAQATALASGVPVIDDLGFHLAVDGELVTAPAQDGLVDGPGGDLPLLVGVTSEEHLLWMGPTGVVDLINEETLALVAARKGLPDAVVDAYRRSRPTSPGHLLGRLLSDQLLRAPMVAVADGRARNQTHDPARDRTRDAARDQAGDPADPARPADPAKPAEPADPAVPAKPADPATKPANPAKPADPADPADRAKPANPAEPAGSADRNDRRSAVAPTFVYEFAWRSPVGGLGAGHSVELPFVFANLDAPEGRLLVGDDAPAALARTMHEAWARFARGEDPGWPAWDERRPARVFDGAADPVADDLHPAEREAMAAVLRNVTH